MVTLLNGRAISKALKKNMKREIVDFCDRGYRPPGLAVVLVGEDPASQIYVKHKIKACHKTGITSHEYRLPESATQQQLLDTISFLNQDPEIDGILVQLPLPDQIDQQTIINAIDVAKDVDGFHPVNVGRTTLGEDGFIPCTPAGIIHMLRYHNIEISGQHAVIVGRSNIVGKPMAALLLKEHATVTICHSRTQNLAAITRQADILIVAVGQKHLITEGDVKEGAIVIDVGMNRTEDGLCGDVDFERIAPKCSYITPVPGGVGPMTITSLLENTLKSYRKTFQE